MREGKGGSGNRVLQVRTAVVLLVIILGMANATLDALFAELVDEVELVEVDIEGVEGEALGLALEGLVVLVVVKVQEDVR